MSKKFDPDTATGTVARHMPAGAELDGVLVVIRAGVKFWKQQHAGKGPGQLSRLVLACARRAGAPYSFEQLLWEFDLEAGRRAHAGERASPVEEVNRAWLLVTLHVHGRGRVQVPFGTLRNRLTVARKILHAEIPVPPKP